MERKINQAEVIFVAEKELTPLAGLSRQIRERVVQELQAQAERFERLERSLQELREQQKQFEVILGQQLDALDALEVPAVSAPVAEAPLEKLLASVRNLIVATLPEQVFDVLCEEAEQMGGRAAVFDVRGKAAWGSAARGFGSRLPQKTFHRLVVSLTQENPFRQVYETGAHVQGDVALLKRNRNVLDGFKPPAGETFVLLPVRSAGSVSAIFYVDAGGKGEPLPTDALRILAEFAGAQLDRLMALSGGLPPEVESVKAAEEEVASPEPVESTEAVEAEPVIFKNWHPRTVTARLKSYGIPTPRKIGSRREFRDVTPEVLRRIQQCYGIDLDFPPDQNDTPTDPGRPSQPSQPSQK
jgi:hypothetical protein